MFNFCYFSFSCIVGLTPLSSSISSTINEAVSLRCELTGYLTMSSDIQWIRDKTILTNIGSKYMITNKLGSGNAINSSGMMTQSIISQLTISNLNQSDSGSYICTVPGIGIQQTITVTISRFTLY